MFDQNAGRNRTAGPILTRLGVHAEGYASGSGVRPITNESRLRGLRPLRRNRPWGGWSRGWGVVVSKRTESANRVI